jgi:hypothetical protein
MVLSLLNLDSRETEALPNLKENNRCAARASWTKFELGIRPIDSDAVRLALSLVILQLESLPDQLHTPKLVRINKLSLKSELRG